MSGARWRRLLTAMALVSVVGLAARGADADVGLRLGVRSGVAFPAGEAFKGSGSLSQRISGQVPVRLEVGYRPDPHVVALVSWQFGVLLPNACPTGEHCSGADVRVGAALALHPLPRLAPDPWISGGIGYEILSLSQTVSGRDTSFGARGFEVFELQVGADFKLAAPLRLGPFASGSIARFETAAINGVSTADFDRSLHGWIGGGLRGAWDL